MGLPSDSMYPGWLELTVGGGPELAPAATRSTETAGASSTVAGVCPYGAVARERSQWGIVRSTYAVTSK